MLKRELASQLTPIRKGRITVSLGATGAFVATGAGLRLSCALVGFAVGATSVKDPDNGGSWMPAVAWLIASSINLKVS